MTPELLDRLQRCGGDYLDEVSPWETYRIFTPRGSFHRIVWASEDAIAELCDECERNAVNQKAMNGVALTLMLNERQALLSLVLPDGRVLDLIPQIYNLKLAISADVADEGALDVWEYADLVSALTAIAAWDGESEPTGWIRHPSSGRRRPGGDPAKEVVRP